MPERFFHMTLYDEILADAPYLWYRFEDVNSLGDPSSESSGSVKMSVSGDVISVPGKNGISDLAVRVAESGAAIRNTNLGSDTVMRPQVSMTAELWFKRNSASSTSHSTLLYRRSGSGSVLIAIAPSNDVSPRISNAVYLQNGGGSTTVTSSDAVVNDTDWHHVAVTSTGSTLALYLDGVLIGTRSANAINTGTTGQELWIGSQSTSGSLSANAEIDEVAIYKTTLDASRIQAHYEAGSTVASVSISNQAPATTIGLIAPAPVVTATRPNVKSAAPAMTAGLTSPAPVITAVDATAPVAYAAIADRDQSYDTPTDLFLSSVSSYKEAYIQFAPVNFNDGALVPASANLKLTIASTGNDSGVFSIRRLTQPFTESEISSIYDPAVFKTSVDYGITFTTPPNVASGAILNLDITPIVQAWADGASQYGVAIVHQSGGILRLATREHATVAWRPVANIGLQARPQVPTVNQAPAMTLNFTMPQHRSGAGTKASVTGAGSLAVNGVAPTTSAQRNLKFSPHAMTLTQLFPGGTAVTPDVMAKVDGPVAEYYVSTPNVAQYVEVPAVNVVPVMELGTVELSDITLNFNTDRKVKVNNPMSMTTRLVGIYNAEADRYMTLVAQTVDWSDIWLPLDDVSGDVARDLAFEALGNNSPCYYRGNPQLSVDGPHLRKAVRFDGVDDFIQLQYPARYVNKVSFEFSIRTTQQNGTILSGGGAWDDLGVAGPAPLRAMLADDQPQIRIVNGRIAIYTGNRSDNISALRATYLSSAYVADGEWHHVVVSIPFMTNRGDASQYVGENQAIYVAMDGRIRWTSYAPALSAFRPLSAMAAASVDNNGVVTASNAVAGDMSHLIIRDSSDLGQALTPQMAIKLYYEWSNATLIQPEPMVLTVNATDPHRARGNRKRMIVLCGLPNGGFNSPTFSHREAYTYWSIFAGYYIGIEDYPGFKTTSTGANGGAGYWGIAPFILEDYMCYPVVAYSEQNISGATQLSAEGMEKEGIRDPITRQLLDTETGLPRFINLQEDLREPIENYDAITALNYPAEEPTWDAYTWGGTRSRVGDYYDPKQWTRLPATLWKSARDKLRDSILDAAYSGVNLWIPEPQMAQHLGFIQSYDIHVPGYIGQEPTRANPMATPTVSWAPQKYEARVYNKRGDELDAAHVTGGQAYRSGPDLGGFHWIWQINSKRVITATEPGLTDLPGAFIKDQIDYQATDRWQPHSRVTAYEVLRRPDGLQVGDSFQMNMTLDSNTSTIGPGYSAGNPRRAIVSARPEGVAGKVISKEIDFYYGANGAVVTNPFAGNVITIAAERGTVVRGRPIMGRAFVEFMSPETEQETINIDSDPSMWGGNSGSNISTWDFDSRRYRELVASQIVAFTDRRISIDKNGSMTMQERSGNREVQWYERQARELTMLPYMSMNARGLYWLGQLGTIPAGTIRTFATSMEITLNSVAPKITRTGGAVSRVVGPMRVDIDFRQPRNFRGADAREKSLPMVLNITLPGIGKVVKAGPIELNITAPNNVRGVGSGDRIFVYMDAGTNVTLYIEEK